MALSEGVIAAGLFLESGNVLLTVFNAAAPTAGRLLAADAKPPCRQSSASASLTSKNGSPGY